MRESKFELLLNNSVILIRRLWTSPTLGFDGVDVAKKIIKRYPFNDQWLVYQRWTFFNFQYQRLKWVEFWIDNGYRRIQIMRKVMMTRFVLASIEKTDEYNSPKIWIISWPQLVIHHWSEISAPLSSSIEMLPVIDVVTALNLFPWILYWWRKKDRRSTFIPQSEK